MKWMCRNGRKITRKPFRKLIDVCLEYLKSIQNRDDMSIFCRFFFVILIPHQWFPWIDDLHSITVYALRKCSVEFIHEEEKEHLWVFIVNLHSLVNLFKTHMTLSNEKVMVIFLSSGKTKWKRLHDENCQCFQTVYSSFLISGVNLLLITQTVWMFSKKGIVQV